MATTTNFNWSTPDDTSLVKDGAAAIRTLGQSIDTSMAELKGGTTGQVLSKTSNTDMDFTWVAQDDSNAIQNAIVDAKGDLIAATANDTPARLAVGNNGETLVADSSTSTGLRYQVPVNVNPVLNSAMQVWQRGTSFNTSVAGAYLADRWCQNTSSSSSYTMSRQATNDSTNLPFIQYCMRIARGSGLAGSNVFVNQSLEILNSIPYAGKTVTMSFYARAGAGNTQTVTANVYAQTTASELNVNLAGTWTTPLTQSISLSTTWTRYTLTGTIGATTTQIALGWQLSTASSSVTSTDYVEITGVQLEVGSVATPFKTYAGTIQGELAACQRYYYRQTANAGTAYTRFTGSTPADSTTQIGLVVQNPVQMRVQPSAVEYSNLTLYGGGFGTLSTIALATDNNNLITLLTVTGSGLTQYRPYALIANNTASAYLGLSAEL